MSRRVRRLTRRCDWSGHGHRSRHRWIRPGLRTLDPRFRPRVQESQLPGGMVFVDRDGHRVCQRDSPVRGNRSTDAHAANVVFAVFDDAASTFRGRASFWLLSTATAEPGAIPRDGRHASLLRRTRPSYRRRAHRHRSLHRRGRARLAPAWAPDRTPACHRASAQAASWDRSTSEVATRLGVAPLSGESSIASRAG